MLGCAVILSFLCILVLVFALQIGSASHGPAVGSVGSRSGAVPCGITGLDVCMRKPLVVTCGVDGTVRGKGTRER